MKTIIGAAIGNCVHVGGLYNFLKIAEREGYSTQSLGPAVPLDRLMNAIRDGKPSMVALSYRLSPLNARLLFEELKVLIQELNQEVSFVFGGPPPVAAEATESGIFHAVFDGTEHRGAITAYLRGTSDIAGPEAFPADLVSRIRQKYPYPVIRHHYGRPLLAETLEGVRDIAMSEVLDVISIGPDQNAQEFFFNPSGMEPSLDGAGGVAVRTAADLEAIYNASRCGNFPLLRIYAGTNDLMKWARMSVATIRNAWAAIPLCWYSVIDGRSKRSIATAVSENQSVMKWYAGKGIPVEVNESHQWSLRDAHDALAVAMAYLAAWNAKKMGVRHYVSQFMFNTPPGIWPMMDVAKMMAKLELINRLEDDTFTVFREVRAGIAHFSSDPAVAKGQLAASAAVSLAMKPHILHVVGFSEGDHATGAPELIESCNIVHGVLRNCLNGMPDFLADQRVAERKEQLLNDAQVILDGLTMLADKGNDPFSDPVVIEQAIQSGLLDAPHFKGNPHLAGKIFTRVIDGTYYPVDRVTGDIENEKERVMRILHTMSNRV